MFPFFLVRRLRSLWILCVAFRKPARNSYVNAQNLSAFSRRFLSFFGKGRTRLLQEAELNLARALPSSLCRDDVGTNAARSARDCPGPVLPRRAQIAMGAEAICSRACAAAARILNVHD